MSVHPRKMALSLAIGVALPLTTAPPNQERQQDSAPQECRVELTPDILRVRHEPSRVLADFRLPLPATPRVLVPDTSGLHVKEVAARAGDRTAVVTLLTRGARPGRWSLVFQGGFEDDEPCTASIRVGAGAVRTGAGSRSGRVDQTR